VVTVVVVLELPDDGMVVVGTLTICVFEVGPGTVVADVPLVAGFTGLDVVVEEFGPSGDEHPVGGTPEPDCPGISTVPAQPKLENVATKVTVPPSANVSTDLTCRMKPAPSIETAAVFAV
jgi:hypothetical protein